jgi:hypothetical protein
MPNIIQQAEVSSFKLGTFEIADKRGTGNATIQPVESGAILLGGNRSQLTIATSNRDILQHESCQVWINTGAAAVEFLLPTGAAIGTAAYFIRTGGEISVNPTSEADIWSSASGLARPAGQRVFLASSGAKFAVVSDGNNRWYPILEEGTIQ